MARCGCSCITSCRNGEASPRSRCFLFARVGAFAPRLRLEFCTCSGVNGIVFACALLTCANELTE